MKNSVSLYLCVEMLFGEIREDSWLKTTFHDRFNTHFGVLPQHTPCCRNDMTRKSDNVLTSCKLSKCELEY